MKLPKEAKREAQIKLSTYFHEKIPEEYREEINLEYNFWGNKVNLVEKRPHWREPDEWTECRFAQFRYDPETKKWSLLWLDSSGNLHPYEELVPGFGPAEDLAELIEEVDQDPTGIFWG